MENNVNNSGGDTESQSTTEYYNQCDDQEAADADADADADDNGSDPEVDDVGDLTFESDSTVNQPIAVGCDVQADDHDDVNAPPGSASGQSKRSADLEDVSYRDLDVDTASLSTSQYYNQSGDQLGVRVAPDSADSHIKQHEHDVSEDHTDDDPSH